MVPIVKNKLLCLGVLEQRDELDDFVEWMLIVRLECVSIFKEFRISK